MSGEVKTPTKVGIERISVTDAGGRVWDLGCPGSRLFRLRVWIYRLKRRI